MRNAERAYEWVSGGCPTAVYRCPDQGGATPAPPAQAGWWRQRLSDPILQDVFLASLLTAASLVGLLHHLHVDLPEAAMSLYLALGYFTSFASFGFLVALYTVAAHCDRRVSVPAAAGSALVVPCLLIGSHEPIEVDTIFAELLVVGAVWFIGEGLQVQRDQVIDLEDRATRLEREREQAALAAVAEERRVVARELHDLVAHNVSVTVAQSAAAQRVFDSNPEEGRAVLHSIEDSGREALVEMRRLLGLLRADGDGPATRHPQQGLADVDSLLAQVRDAGLAVDLTVDDDGRGRGAIDADPSQARFGHLGKRERVAVSGGRLDVGTRQGGGCRVAGSLPLEGAPR